VDLTDENQFISVMNRIEGNRCRSGCTELPRLFYVLIPITNSIETRLSFTFRLCWFFKSGNSQKLEMGTNSRAMKNPDLLNIGPFV
jgi:hypothetical protein